MGLSNALFSSVSGLDTTSTAISVIGDNIANVNTPGFKEKRAEFSDVLGQSITGVTGASPLGSGARLSRVSTVFSQGALESTGRPEDLSIQGRGFFMLDGDQGRFYSRAGIFEFDNEGTLVNPNGLRVQGFGIDPVTGESNGQLGDITRSNALSPPRPSSSLNISMNLDAREPVTVGGFDPTNPVSSSESRTGVTLYDSLGNGHFSTLYFNKTAANTWEWNAALQASDTTLPPVPGGDDAVVQGSGTLTFDSDGALTGVTGNSVTFEFSGGATGSQTIDIDFGLLAAASGQAVTTSFAELSTTNSFDQDGFGPGTLQAIRIGQDGVVEGQFSNGETAGLAQIALASFPNLEGLQSVGAGNLVETRASGQPLIDQPNSGGYGSIRSGSLEQSTVDLAAQFVRLIVNQRAFQANTRTVSVTNELLANLVSLGQ